MSSFGERVRETRIARGMTQQQLADAIGMKSRSTINKIELGSRNTKLDTATKIARALNVDPDYYDADLIADFQKHSPLERIKAKK